MMLDFGDAVRRFYGNYTNPEGRAQRSAFWWVQLYQSIMIMVAGIVILMADGGPEFFETLPGVKTFEELNALFLGIGSSGKMAMMGIFAFSAVNFLPGIMLSIRRFHDLGRSGWFVLAFITASMVPVLGTLANIANLIWFTVPGTNGANQYGPDPLGPDGNVFR